MENSGDKPSPETELVTVTVEELDSTTKAIMALAGQIIPPIVDAQKRSGEIQIEAAKLQAAGAVKVAQVKMDALRMVLRAPITYALAILLFGITAYALYLGKEAWVTDIMKVGLGAVIGFLAGRQIKRS